jgi:ABC-type tungstate transport system substrate-binding protein
MWLNLLFTIDEFIIDQLVAITPLMIFFMPGLPLPLCVQMVAKKKPGTVRIK